MVSLSHFLEQTSSFFISAYFAFFFSLSSFFVLHPEREVLPGLIRSTNVLRLMGVPEPLPHHEEGGEHPQEIPGGNLQDQEKVRQVEGGPGDNLQDQEEVRQVEGIAETTSKVRKR